MQDALSGIGRSRACRRLLPQPSRLVEHQCARGGSRVRCIPVGRPHGSCVKTMRFVRYKRHHKLRGLGTEGEFNPLPLHFLVISDSKFQFQGSTLAVGTLSGRLHIYDATTLEPVRTYNQAHNQRVGAISWNRSVLSSGSRDRMIYHRDIRERDTRPFKKCAAHRQEVCGLRWSNDDGANSSLLASGGNDNKVFIWDLRGSARGRGSSPYGIGSGAFAQSRTGSTSSGVSAGVAAGDDLGEIPLHRFTQHTAAVKALAWDPHVPGILATGGGTQDKHIRFWNTNTPQGTLLSELDTGSQVNTDLLAPFTVKVWVLIESRFAT